MKNYSQTPEAGFNAYIKHFHKIAEQMGYEYLPPEEQVSTLVWYLDQIKQAPEKAILFAEMNVRNYPQSEHAQNQLTELKHDMRRRNNE